MQTGKDTEYTYRRVAVLYIAPGERVECTDFYLAGQKVTSESNTVYRGINRMYQGRLMLRKK